MSSSVTITKAAKLAGITRQTMSRKVSDGEVSKNNEGKIDISELLRLYPDIKIGDTESDTKVSKFDTTLHPDVKLLEQEIKHLKQRVSDLENQLDEVRQDKANLTVILKQQTASLPDPNIKKRWWNK